MYVIVNIIKFKRMQGLNFLSFGEQRFFLYYAGIACLHGFLLMGRGIVGREGGREGGREVFCVVRFHSNILRRHRDVVPPCQ